jgi:hypothetical protein
LNSVLVHLPYLGARKPGRDWYYLHVSFALFFPEPSTGVTHCIDPKVGFLEFSGLSILCLELQACLEEHGSDDG